MNIEEAFPSKYLKASDLGGKTARVTIRSVLMEEVGKEKDRKPVIYFEGKEKGLVLNRTNANAISIVYGQDTDDWPGAELELFTVMTDFNGQAREAVRLRIAPRKPAARTNGAPAIQTGGARFMGNARDDARLAAGQPDDRVGAPLPPLDEDEGDSIPF